MIKSNIQQMQEDMSNASLIVDRSPCSILHSRPDVITFTRRHGEDEFVHYTYDSDRLHIVARELSFKEAEPILRDHRERKRIEMESLNRELKALNNLLNY